MHDYHFFIAEVEYLFSLMFIKQVMYSRKVRSNNLKIMTDLQLDFKPRWNIHGPLLYKATQRNIFSSHVFLSKLLKQAINIKIENWELEIQGRTLRSSYGWPGLVSNTVTDYFQ